MALSALPGISGREQAVRRYIVDELNRAPGVERVRVDGMGNVLAELRGKQRAACRVLFAAHMDEVGGMVTGITEDGYVRFFCVGGVAPEVLFAHRVTVNGHGGVIGAKAIHQCGGDEKKKVPSVEAMLIDIGAETREQAEQAVSVGDAVVFAENAAVLQHRRFAGKALDDRAGCALLLALAQTQPEYDVCLAFTVQEEVGLRGAGCAAFAVQPDIAVAVDATTAADVCGVAPEKQVCRLGGGAVVSFMDRATVYDKPLFDKVMRLADERGIAVQTKTVIAGGNDAGSMQSAGAGTRVAAVSLPCRYLHSPACVLDEQDVDATYRLLAAMMDVLPAGGSTQ